VLPEPLLAEPAPARQPSTAAARLELRGLRKQWGSAPPVLGNVDMDVHAGSVVALVGRNGAGKTTLLRIAAGLIAPDRGRVALDGLDPFANRREYQQRLGFVSAGQGGLYARLTVRQHLDLWARLAFVPRHERAAAIASTIEHLELAAKIDGRVDRLSAGQRQRVRVAMAFLHRPSLVLLDEPHTSLDEDGISALERLIRGLVDEGGTVMCCAPSAAALGLAVDEVYRAEGGEVLPA
jgi:ABC-2 type transport system ATP-binding protein